MQHGLPLLSNRLKIYLLHSSWELETQTPSSALSTIGKARPWLDFRVGVPVRNRPRHVSLRRIVTRIGMIELVGQQSWAPQDLRISQLLTPDRCR
jgi:hypothetical protein